MVRHATGRQVSVRVPATTANLGCGFDVLGLALQIYNTFTLVLTPEPGWRAMLPAGVDLPSDADNLVFKAARAVFAKVGNEPAGLQLFLDMDIPLARGLGSSSAAIIGGLLAANALAGNAMKREALLDIAVEMEGHPDNVTPALMGGLTLSYAVDGCNAFLPLDFPSDLKLVVAIPDFELPTAKARAVLPPQISRADAVFNCSRTALLVAALQSRRYDLLPAAMDDRLHQPFRAALVPGMEAAMAAGYRANALGVVLSGAGPTLVALAHSEPDAVASAISDAFAAHQVTCRTQLVKSDVKGAVIC